MNTVVDLIVHLCSAAIMQLQIVELISSSLTSFSASSTHHSNPHLLQSNQRVMRLKLEYDKVTELLT